MQGSNSGLLHCKWILYQLSHKGRPTYWSVYSNYLLLDSVLVGCMFLNICPFLLGCIICWHIIIASILLQFFLYLWIISCYFSFLISYFVFWGHLSSSWWAWPEVCQFHLPFQKTSSWFYWFFSLLKDISIWLISSVIFTIFFLLLIPDFVLIFIILLSGRLGYLRFIMFLKRINCFSLFSFWV